MISFSFTPDPTSKLAHSNSIKAALGNTDRRLILARNGTVFRDVGITGDFAVTSGNITYFGLTTGTTVSLAADLMTGSSTLRVEGNGNWTQGTLGLTRAAQKEISMACGMTEEQADAAFVAYDYYLSANPTATSGIGFAADCALRAPTTYRSGTGPEAPAPDANAIVALQLLVYNADETVEIDGGTMLINVREPDMVMDRPFMAQHFGDVRRMRVADGAGLVFGEGGNRFKFGVEMRTMHAGTNSEANVPLHEGEAICMPHGRWPNWPFRGGLNLAVDTMIPPAHKLRWLRADGSIAHVTEDYSTRVNDVPGTGWPVNSFRIQQDVSVAPVRGFWTCAMMHPYQSHQPKMTPFAAHLITPMRDGDGLFHPKNVSERGANPYAWPLMGGGQSLNGMGALRVAPKWPGFIGSGLDTAIIDTNYSYSNLMGDDNITQWLNYGHGPGMPGHHTVYGGYGGPRATDRGGVPNPIITWITFPDGIRAHGAVPNKEMARHWMLNYCNIGQHYFTNVERGTGIQKSKVLNGEICFLDTFYAGASETFRPDLDNNGVRLLASGRQSSVSPLDQNLRRFSQDQMRDVLHSSSNAAPGGYVGGSTINLRGAAHSLIAHILCAFDLTQQFRRWEFLTRQHVWCEKNFVDLWIAANNLPDGFPSTEVEGMWQRHYERMYDAVMPGYLTGTDVWAITLRNLGIGSEIVTNPETGINQINFNEDSKACYMGEPLMLMKQSGAWDAMYAKSPKCAAIMDLIKSSMVKLTTGPFVDANGVGIDKYYYDKLPTISNANMATPELMNAALSNWGQVYPPDGLMDWIRGTDGVIGSQNNGDGIDGTNTMHYRAQTLFILRDFGFASGARVDAACAKVDTWYAEAHAGFLAGTNFMIKYRNLNMGIHSAPDYVGPPV